MNQNLPLENTPKRKRIPHYVAKQYEGGARGFKKEKRRQLKALIRAYADLRVGCVFLPSGIGPMEQMEKALSDLSIALSEKNWGR